MPAEFESSRRKLLSPDTLECVRCLEIREAGDLDRLRWCERCNAVARKSAQWWGHGLGLAAAAILAAWIVWAVQPGQRYILFWLAAMLVMYRLTDRLGKELAYGVMRFRNRRGARATSEPGPGA